MAHVVPSKGMPLSDIFENDIYKFKVEKWVSVGEDARTQNGFYQLSGRARCIEPQEWAGTTLFLRFCLGSQKDPDGTDPELLKKSGFFKDSIKLINGCGFDTESSDVDLENTDLTGCDFIAHVGKKEVPEKNRKGEPNTRAGQFENPIYRVWRSNDPKAPKPGSRTQGRARTTAPVTIATAAADVVEE